MSVGARSAMSTPYVTRRPRPKPATTRMAPRARFSAVKASRRPNPTSTTESTAPVDGPKYIPPSRPAANCAARRSPLPLRSPALPTSATQVTEIARPTRLSGLVKPVAQPSADPINATVHNAPTPAAHRSVRFFGLGVATAAPLPRSVGAGAGQPHLPGL